MMKKRGEMENWEKCGNGEENEEKLKWERKMNEN